MQHHSLHDRLVIGDERVHMDHQSLHDYSKDLIAKMKLRKISARDRNDIYVGKTFHDPCGKGPKRTTDFDRGVFVVLCRQHRTNPSYWCERSTDIRMNSKRDIQVFSIEHVRGLVNEYGEE